MNKTEVIYGKHRDPERKEHWSLFFLKNREMVSNKIWFMLVWEVPFVRVTLKKLNFFDLVDGGFFCNLIYYVFCFLGFLLPVYMQKRLSKGTKRKTRQAKALENARKAPRTFLELLHEVTRVLLLILSCLSSNCFAGTHSLKTYRQTWNHCLLMFPPI